MLPVEGGDEYANPAITPGNSTDSETATTETGDPASSAESNPQPALLPLPKPANAVDPATVARIEHLIGVECNRVKEAAAKAVGSGRNFLEWVDDFYAKKWEPKLAGWLEDCGLDRGKATDHCNESKQRLLELCDYSSDETLVDNINKGLASWKARASQVITKGE